MAVRSPSRGRRSIFLALAGLFCAGSSCAGPSSAGCQRTQDAPPPEAKTCAVPGPFAGTALPATTGAPIPLPSPATTAGMPLRQALATRRSQRTFGEEALTLNQVGQLLWAGQGVTSPEGHRTSPSAGALFPFEVYLVAERVRGLAPGLYHYRVGEHHLALVRPGHFAERLQAIAVGQAWVGEGAASFVLVGVVPRTAQKYRGRAERFVAMESGAIAQSMLLQATDLGLGAVLVGGFEEAALQKLIGSDAYPLAVVTVGPR